MPDFPTAARATHLDPARVQSQLDDLLSAATVWFQTHWLQIAIAVGVGAVIVIALTALRRLGVRLCERRPGVTDWWTVFGRAITRTNTFFIVMTAAKLVEGYANAPVQVHQTITFLFTVAAAFQSAVWAREIILGSIEHRTSSDHYHGEALTTAMGLIRLLVTLALFSVAAVVVLSNLGVNVTGLVAGLGVGGIAIGLAAQGIFADLFAALAIIFDRPFRRNDAITYGAGSSGTVEAIGLKSTRIRAPTGEERVISNKNLLDKEIVNNTRREYRRVKFTLGLVCWTPVEVMEQIPALLRGIVEAHEVKFVRAGFVNFGASSYDFEVEFDSPTAAFQDAYDARHAIGLAIIKAFNTRRIDLAYPTQTGFTAAPDGGLIMPYPDEPHSDGRGGGHAGGDMPGDPQIRARPAESRERNSAVDE